MRFPKNGMLKQSNGKWVYTPEPGFVGKDEFEYEITDGQATDIGLVTVDVRKSDDPPPPPPVNQGPVAVDDTFEMVQDTVLTIDPAELLANDYDPDGDRIFLTDNYPKPPPPPSPGGTKITEETDPWDAIAIIENAKAGDVITVSGKHHFRVALSNPGVTVKAEDPNNPPEFDYSVDLPQMLPGSYGSSHWKAQYGWVLEADDLTIEDIIIHGVKTNAKGSGIYVDPDGTIKEPATAGTQHKNCVIRRVEIYNCDDALNSVGIDLLLDNVNFHDSGPNDGKFHGCHHLYIQGGSFRAINSKFDRSMSAQNIMFRGFDGVFEDCDFGTVASYCGHVNSPKADYRGEPLTQRLAFYRCNISGIRGVGTPQYPKGLSKAFAIGCGANIPNLTQILEFHDTNYKGNAQSGVLCSIYREIWHKKIAVIGRGGSFEGFSKMFYLTPTGSQLSAPVYEIDFDSKPDGVPWE